MHTEGAITANNHTIAAAFNIQSTLLFFNEAIDLCKKAKKIITDNKSNSNFAGAFHDASQAISKLFDLQNSKGNEEIYQLHVFLIRQLEHARLLQDVEILDSIIMVLEDMSKR